MTPQCPTCEGVGSVLVCSNCQNPACARGEMFCERYRTSGFDHITCKDCGGKGTIPSSKEPKQPKKVDTFTHAKNGAKRDCPKCKGAGTYMYDDVHGTICDLCCKHDLGWWELPEGYSEPGKMCCMAGCGKTRDKTAQENNLPTTPSKEDTECTCSSRLAADPGKWPSRSGIHEEKCPLHGEPKQEYLDERTLEDILREMLSGEHDSRYAQEEIKSLFNAWHTQKLREVRNTVAKRIKSCPEEDFGKTDAIVYLDSAIDRALKETE